LIEGSSIDPEVVAKVKAEINSTDRVLVTLDSCHTKSHVLGELDAYSPVVSQGSYIVAMDGIMEDMAGAPRSQEDWTWNNPKAAALEFVQAHPDFVIEEPPFKFNEGNIGDRVTYWPAGFIKRVSK
jgi:cephalosporin hydroxylase